MICSFEKGVWFNHQQLQSPFWYIFSTTYGLQLVAMSDLLVKPLEERVQRLEKVCCFWGFCVPKTLGSLVEVDETKVDFMIFLNFLREKSKYCFFKVVDGILEQEHIFGGDISNLQDFSLKPLEIPGRPEIPCGHFLMPGLN